MKYTLLGSEDNVSEIAVRVFGNLPAAKLAEAEGLLLNANPELGAVNKMQPGALIRIPDTAKIPNAEKGETVDPIEGMKADIIRQLKALEREVRRSHKRHRQHQENSAKVLHSVRKDLQEHPHGEVVSGQLKKHFRESEKSDDESKDMGLKALRKLKKSAGSVS